jgi:hypothetical protein
MTGGGDCWGPYRSAVQERLDICDDYLGRLRRSLAGEIAPDRFYFGDKAHALRDAAQALIDGVDDVEWWLGTCGAEMRGDGTGDAAEISECGRAAGHPGPHLPDGRCPEQEVLARARAVANELGCATDRLAWGLLTVRAGADITNPRSLAVELRQIGAQLSRTATALEALEAVPSEATKAE